MGVGLDHCRVVPPDDNADVRQQVEFFRHLFAYAEASRRIPSRAWVLEIGAGEGYGTRYLSSTCSNIFGSDLSLQALKHANSRYPDVQFLQSLGTGLPFPTGTFDVVVSFQVIEHIADVTRYISEVHRALKPGRRFILTTPNRKLRLLPFQRPRNPYHVHEYGAAELRRTLERDFAHVQVQGVMARPDIMSFEKVSLKQNPARVYGYMVEQLIGKVLPRSLLHPLKMLMRSLIREQKPISGQSTASISAGTELLVSLKDFFLSSDVDNSLDLFVIATKGL